mgnify:CR=1 FL=1
MRTYSDRPLLFGHRGARARCPENTLAALQAALSDGAHALELDVQVTADGVVVVMHDGDGLRMCGAAAAVRATPYSTLRTWDAGYGFVAPDGTRPFAGQGLGVPRLDEVLAALPGVPVNIDLKPADPGCAARVIDVVTALGASERVLLTSFHDAVLQAVRASRYDGRLGFARRDVLALWSLPLWVLRRRRPRGHRVQLPVQAGPLRFDGAGFIAKMHALDLAVDYWVINDRDQGARLLERGADGLMSDVPGLLAPLFAS